MTLVEADPEVSSNNFSVESTIVKFFCRKHALGV